MNKKSMQRLTIIIIDILLCNFLFGQQIPLPENLPQSHPRLMTTSEKKIILEEQLKTEEWAKDIFEEIRQRVDRYVEKAISEPDWLYSRLMMYWESKATQVYINGGVYSYADGKAPIATVRFGSTRGMRSVYKRPALEDIIPYMDDTKGVYFRNTSVEGSPFEWIDQSNVSGGDIESVNAEIVRIAKDASFLYWITDNEEYGKLALGVFDTYLMGMYYRKEPIDIGNGHAQTLAGLSTFEVIQESILHELSYTYDYLHSYIKKNKPEHIEKYAETFKKWIDITIKNGVPHNNWNLHQAKIILKVAMILEDNNSYRDGKGREYYIDYILNQTSPRQWSMTKFMEYGYDYDNGVWNECPGYAQGVTRDLTNFIRDYDNTFNQNLLPYMPVMEKAVKMLPQYLFPNGVSTAFGDTYYTSLNTEAISDMIHLAKKYGNKKSEVDFTQMYFLFNSTNEVKNHLRKSPAQISSFFTAKPFTLDNSIQTAKKEDYITQTFYAPNVSWFVQRNNDSDPYRGLMISQYASLGNHAHANGIAMELYGKGYVLGAESGIGSTYFEKPYLEYYSQFPAHNTVMVDGISKYPEMFSNHSFDLLACYPQSEQKSGYYTGITFSDVYFFEPESKSDQKRMMSIINTSGSTGYYVDIFRSKKQRGGDKFHDYFYHNLGQELIILDTDGNEISLHENDEMAFAGGHLFAFDYMWDKKSAKTDKDYEAVWKMSMKDNNHIYMNLWMKGYKGREIFSIKAPSCKAYSRMDGELPYEIDKFPFLTISARQHGEAWEHPFVSIFEACSETESRSIDSIHAFEVENATKDFVGLVVKSKSGRTDYIFSSVSNEIIEYNDMSVNGSYAVVSQLNKDFVLFLGDGTYLKANGFTIETSEKTNAVLEYKNGNYYFTCTKPVIITTPQKKNIKIDKSDFQKINLK